MATILSLYNLAELGVNVDSSNLHVPDGAVRKSQNLITDPKGFTRGIKNRDGLQRFNELAAAGSVLGGICVPLPDTRTPPEGNNVELFLGASNPPPSSGFFLIEAPWTEVSLSLTGNYVEGPSDTVIGLEDIGSGTFSCDASVSSSVVLWNSAGSLVGTFTEAALPEGFTIDTWWIPTAPESFTDPGVSAIFPDHTISITISDLSLALDEGDAVSGVVGSYIRLVSVADTGDILNLLGTSITLSMSANSVTSNGLNCRVGGFRLFEDVTFADFIPTHEFGSTIGLTIIGTWSVA